MSVKRARSARCCLKAYQGSSLYYGKLLAIGAVVGLLSVPALFSSFGSSLLGESWLASATLYFANVLYLSVWAALSLFVSLLTRSRGLALGVLSAVWVLSVLVIPRIGVTFRQRNAPKRR